MMSMVQRKKILWDNLRISQRMLVSYILTILIPVVIINALTFITVRNTALDTVAKTIDVTLDNGNSLFNALFTGLNERAVATSSTPELAYLFDETRDATVSGSVPTLKLSETLSALKVIYDTSPQYYYTFYAERQNLAYHSGNLQIISSYPANLQDWYQEAIRFGEGVYWRDVHEDTSFGFSRRFVTACRVIGNERNGALGLATVSLDFTRVEEAFTSLMEPYRGTIYILDSTGQTLFSRSIGNESLSIDNRVTMPEQAMPDEIRSVVLGKESGSGRLGSKAIYNFASIDQLMWKVVTVLPQDQFFGMTNNFWSFLVPVLLGTTIVFLIVTLKVSRTLSRPIEVLSASMMSEEEQEFPMPYLLRQDEIGDLARAYARVMNRNAQLIEETRQVNEKKRLFQLEALQRQINSHFIHNTLNNIQWLAAADRSDDVISTTTSLSKLLRACATQKDELVTIEDELDYVDSYLNIQKIRFGNRFSYRFDLNPLLLQMKIPLFVLQPIVENSIYHGLIDGNSEEGVILIRIFQEFDHIIITVFDNGRGVAADRLPLVIASGSGENDRFMGIALKNIDTRLKLVFGEASGISVSSHEGQWTEIRIRIPIVGDDSQGKPFSGGFM